MMSPISPWEDELGRTSSAAVATALLAAIYAVSTLASPSALAQSSLLQEEPFQFRLMGLTRSSIGAGMTDGSLGGWNEDDWVPFRLTVTNSGESDRPAEAAIDLEYQNAGRIGIDAFAACFAESAADCGSGGRPTAGSSAVGSGSLWKLLVDSTERTPTATFDSLPGGVQTIRWRLESLSVPAGGSLSIRWAVHLAKGGSTNLACSEGSPLATCSPGVVQPGMGEASWPGRSLQVRAAPPIPGERTVSIDVAQQAPPTTTPGRGCLVATAAYGSEMAPEVVYMRHVRDDLIGSTSAGRMLIAGFNAFYYPWSPVVAETIAGNELLRAVFRILLTPLVWIVHATALVFLAITQIAGGLDAASVVAFLVAALMTIAVYVVLPLFVGMKLIQAIRKRSA